MTTSTQQPPRYKNLRDRYARWAPHYDRVWNRYSIVTLQHAIDALPAEGAFSLLDVACGTGLLGEMVRRRHPTARITGIDASEDMLEKARQRIPPNDRAAWLTGTAESLAVPSHQFDALTCTNAFHLVQDAPAALAEFRRALRRGGRLIIVDWCRDFAVMKMRDLILKIIDHQQRHIYALHELSDAVRRAGFLIDDATRFDAGRGWGLMRIVAHSPGAEEDETADARR